MEEKLTPDRIIALWKADCGEVKTSSQGTTYLVIPLADRRGRLLDLIAAFVGNGYEEQEIRTGAISMKVVKTCWSDLITKMTNKEIHRNREISRHQWEEALDEFFVKELPKYVKPEKPISFTFKKPAPVEKQPDIEPKDRIKVDISKYSKIEPDVDFLAKLGLPIPKEDE